jgi:chromosome segregation protein
MRIRKLEIQGFKSFADRTAFEFDEGITAIVGPNGCGKSNVVDALKWVLGDMSPRSLRGKRMEDVIFAGSRGRRPLPMADVTLVLDNEDGTLPSEHSEVAVTRRLHRSGDSEYLLNGQVCRLKDIRELFLDTGVGMDGNAIMEQGQIDALLAANPQDRRGIFEEAAGVSRYKQRRKEAEQRLRRTHENLERLRDVLELEEKRLRSLKNQAGRARRYQALREELARKRVLRAVVRYRSITGERDALQEKMDAIGEREAKAAEELAALETEARDVERQREAARERMHEVENRITQAASDERAARDRVEYAARSIEDLRARIADANEKAASAREQIERIRREIAGLEEDARAGDAKAQEQETHVEGVEAELRRIEQDAARIRDAHDGAKRDALNALGRIGEARNEEAQRRTELRQAEERLARLGEQKQEMELRRERIEGEARELFALAATLEEEGRTRAEALAAAESRRAEAMAAAEAAIQERMRVAEERATKAARLEVLTGLAASREGVDEGARRIMEAVEDVPAEADGSRDGVVGLLADLIEPDPGGAARLDRLLGHAAGALVVRSYRDAVRWIDWLRSQGTGERARLLCLDMARGEARAPAGAPIGPLGSDERVEALVRSVVAGTVLVPDLRAGVQEYLERGLNAVTPDGDRVTASGALLGGRDAPSLGLVERSTELRRLKQEMGALTATAEAARTAVTDAEATVAQREEEVRRLRSEIAEHAADRSRRSEALTRVEKERRYADQAIEMLVAEIEEMESLGRQAREAAGAIAAVVAGLESERAQLEERAEEAGRGFLALDAERKEAAERRMEARLTLAESRSRAEAARQRVERARAEIAGLEERAGAYDSEAGELEGRIDAAEIDATEAQALVRSSESRRGEAGAVLVAAREELERLEAGASEGEEKRRGIHQLHEELRGELESFRLRDSEYRTRIDALLEQVRQDHDLDLPAVAAEAEATESLDFARMEAELTELRGKLEALGNVNLNAIEELAEVDEHVTFLQAQEKDLLTGASDLEQAIKELDQVSTERFAKAFNEIRENFRTTFRRLFGGGRADVMLEDASDLLESGIEIIARPPGKEQRTISLLSGGERTLTAVALLFAVFKAKPSPFAILDEVDAALDEANVRRLVNLVREFTDRCQFVIITHAKATMETADLLYGVTMDEPGVSGRVAVRLTEYQPEAIAS